MQPDILQVEQIVAAMQARMVYLASSPVEQLQPDGVKYSWWVVGILHTLPL